MRMIVRRNKFVDVVHVFDTATINSSEMGLSKYLGSNTAGPTCIGYEQSKACILLSPLLSSG